MFASYSCRLGKTRKSTGMRVPSISWFSIKSMLLSAREALTTAAQVLLCVILAAKDDVVNQLLTNLDGV